MKNLYKNIVDNKVYSKEELIELLTLTVMSMEGETFKMQPADPDDFHTSYDIFPIKKDYQLIVAMDIVNPFTYTIKEENLKILFNRIEVSIEQEDINDLGNLYVLIKDLIYNDAIEDIYTSKLVEFLNKLNKNVKIKRLVNFELDKSF